MACPWLGVLEYDSGATYKGNVIMGVMAMAHGNFADGQRYEGRQDDRMHGSGTLTFQNEFSTLATSRLAKSMAMA